MEKGVPVIFTILFIRLSPQLTAFYFFKWKEIRNIPGRKEIAVIKESPGKWFQITNHYLKFASSNGYISVKLQLEEEKNAY